MPRIVSRILEVANERVAGALFVFAMAIANGQGPSWQAVAAVGGGIVMAGGGWVITDRLAQQADRDRKQDEALKEALKENRDALKESVQQMRDLSASAVTRAGEAITSGISLKNSVDTLQKGVSELSQQIQDEREKREAREQKELEELRERAGEREGKKR